MKDKIAAPPKWDHDQVEKVVSIEVYGESNDLHIKFTPVLPGLLRTRLPKLIEQFFEGRIVNDDLRVDIRTMAYLWLASRFEAGLLILKDGKLVETTEKKPKVSKNPKTNEVGNGKDN
jgi:hypothetical protein